VALNRVTITGADNSVLDPEDLLPIARDFPFVEFGILASYNNTIRAGGTCRYPGPNWLERFQIMARREKLNAAIHFNGVWVRDLLIGKNSIPEQFLVAFNRIQLNFHGEGCLFEPQKFAVALVNLAGYGREAWSVRQVIFQLDGIRGENYLDAVRLQYDPDFWFVHCVPLFDKSGGAVRPDLLVSCVEPL